MLSINSLIRPFLLVVALAVPASHFAAESPRSTGDDTYPLSLKVLDARLLIAYTVNEGVELQRVIADSNDEILSVSTLGSFAIECSDRFDGQCKLFNTTGN